MIFLVKIYKSSNKDFSIFSYILNILLLITCVPCSYLIKFNELLKSLPEIIQPIIVVKGNKK